MNKKFQLSAFLAAAVGAVLLSTTPLSADSILEGSLPRRVHIGVGLADATDGNGVLFTVVVPGAPSAQAGLEAGDIITHIDGNPVMSVQQYVEHIQTSNGGDEVVYTGLRGELEKKWRVVYGTLPLESGDGIDVIYGEVFSPAGYKLRSVLTLPANAEGPVPVLYYLQGITCSFVEWPGPQAPPPRQFLHDLSRAGWATYRVEKRGIGDSQGEPCQTMDYVTEGEDFIAGLNTLKGDPRIDAGRVVLFGHSMGGAFGPWMAKDHSVAGVIVYGSSAANWLEYMIKNVRRQSQLSGASYSQATETLNNAMPFYTALFVDHLTPTEIREQRPDAAATMDTVFDQPGGDTMQTRHYSFYHQLSSYNIASWWTEVSVPVLVLRGTADFITDRDEHIAIAETVNTVSPGLATFSDVENADHIFATFESELESMQNGLQGPYNPAVGEVVQGWLGEHWPAN